MCVITEEDILNALEIKKEFYLWISEYDGYHELDNDLKAKLTAFRLGYIPRCECGNNVEFVSKFKSNTKYETKHSTPFGGFRVFCSRLCCVRSKETQKKSKQTHLERRGATSYAASSENKQRGVKKTEEEKKQFKETMERNNLEKYGVKHTSQLDSVKRKREETVLKQTDGKYTNHFQDVKRVQEGNLKKYGVTSWKKTEDGKKASQGKNNPLSNLETREKTIITRMTRNHKDEIFVNIIRMNDSSLFKTYIDKIVEDNNYFHRHEIANHLGLSYSYLNNLFRRFGMYNDYLSLGTSKSYEEETVYQFLTSIYNGEIIRGSRSLLGNGQEIDLYIPEFNFGIEYDNLYTHSEFSGGKDKNYHKTKTDLAEKNDIHLVHILSNEWLIPEKRKIWESMIKNKLGLTQYKIAARKTHIQELPQSISTDFFNNNHLMGNIIGSEKTLGLFYNDELVMALSYGKSRTSKDEYELYRVASKLNVNVIGGFGKLFTYIPDHIKKNLITFADRRFSYCNNVYDNHFNSKEKTSANWWGFQRGTLELMSRWSFTKNNFIKLLTENQSFDESKSIFDNMIDNGYDRIWDCGNWKYKMK